MKSCAGSGIDFQVSPDLLNALAHPSETIARSQLLNASTVVSGTDFHSLCRLDRLDPQVLGPGMPHRICNDLPYATKNRLRANAIIDPQVLWHNQMNMQL